MHGTIHPLPQYDFMAWYSVEKEAQGQIYLHLLPACKLYWIKLARDKVQSSMNGVSYKVEQKVSAM